MKALILSAGFGTRLLPYTRHTPKPLFPISGRPLLEITIQNLIAAGAREIMINTHHLHEKIAAFIDSRTYEVPVKTVYEQEILGTGGAIRNLTGFWDDQPFMVINSDILTNINFKDVYDFHLANPFPVTLVMHDFDIFNNVTVSKDDFVLDFHATENTLHQKNTVILAFTGIQVIDPEVVPIIPENTFYSSIDLYSNLISTQRKIKAYIVRGHLWKDIGTPDAYQEEAIKALQKTAFNKAFPESPNVPVHTEALAGDGSDRRWSRLSKGHHTMIMVNHGIRETLSMSEADAFIAIGSHLFERGVNIPEIYAHDAFAGLVCLEDLGNRHLLDEVRGISDENALFSLYKRVIDLLVDVSLKGISGFDPSFTFQTDTYSKLLILEKECRYFLDAFVNNYLGMNVDFGTYQDDFSRLADRALANAVTGFMHRDLQSKNIMVKDNRFYIIDFQGGRIGPVQYDLASLVIDPYAGLPFSLQTRLAEYCMEKLAAMMTIQKKDFIDGFKYCALTRNLQILGAFGFLSKVKGKTWFEQHIPRAVKTLKHYLDTIEKDELAGLRELAKVLPSDYGT